MLTFRMKNCNKMKKQLLNLFGCATLAFGSMNANAQLADGSFAPDWTFNDINGNPHNLYSYLDQGITVFIDVSATWCAPCWSYYNTNALEDLYNQHGPSGSISQDVMVFYIEGEDGNNTACLYGPTGCTGPNGGTQGDWVTGTPYPIIDPQGTAITTFNNDYNIGYFPTIYKICPNRQIYEVGQLSAANLYSSVGSCEVAVTGTDYSVVSYQGASEVCAAGNLPMSVILQNMGTNALTSGTIEVKNGAATIHTYNWNGNLATYDYTTVNLGNVPVPGSSTLDIVVTNTDVNAGNSTLPVTISEASLVNFTVEVRVNTDYYPGETSWEIRNASTNALVASGGPYTPGTADQWGGGGADANTTKIHTVTLPAGSNCYNFILEDSFGDGLQYGTTTGGFGYQILSTGQVKLNMLQAGAWDFGSSTTRDAAMRTDNTSGIIEAGVYNSFNVYPNPANDQLNVSIDMAVNEDVKIEMRNSVGQVVKVISQNNLSVGSHVITTSLADITSGMYYLHITAGNTTEIRKITVAK